MAHYQYTLEDVVEISQKLLSDVSACIWLFEGDMGVGKTTLISHLCRQLSFDDYRGSPTFSLVNEYQNDKIRLAHFDLYRLENIEELMNIGFEDYLDNNDYIFVEWPAIAMPLLEIIPRATLEMEKINNTTRKIIVR